MVKVSKSPIPREVVVIAVAFLATASSKSLAMPLLVMV
jgi:hypothetical protein